MHVVGRPRLAALAGLVVAVSLSACAGAASPAPSPVATDTVDMPRSYRYSPAAIEVPVGTTVTWTNSDAFTHSVRLLDGDVDLVVRPGETTTYSFPAAGLYPYTCTFHSNDMNGSVLVTDG